MKIFYIRHKTLYKIAIGLTILLLLLSFLVISMGSKSQETFFRDDVYYKGNKKANTIAFACNIDWGEEHIPKMMEIFKENDIKITFFPTGRWAEKNQELIREIQSNGHEIGNHGYLHKDYDKLNFEENKEQILKADEIIKEIIGTSPKYFAPPSGAFNDDTVKAAKDLNYSVIMWSIDTIDWREDSTKDVIVDRVVSKADDSGIVLMHPTEETVKALPEMIKLLKEKGYEIGGINDIIE
ncbi:polysaccharide deacetylase [Gottschalkia acidurici 9a]|uniref:Polysaccharide deacetylase n=1 Tax=Gottschalkia acidurici (strain ATCC 7906 / DSM 604 / BCRC 14475 / CIP 104303 / KCTC 5404 / NCIMB 10678 / 9a) TaxID=1128398 RepID=K0AXK9_GOTA9|nr:polysaccharide deacetylase family protein [Gottschalkia acidurici]AFS78558.1 polysaccharide deacetylase [Gottschalkia acidurici 9a]